MKHILQNNLILVGSLQPNLNTNPTVCDELSQVFIQKGWHVIATSRKSNKILKLMDMIGTCLIHRNKYDIALIDVYSGQAFIWAEIISMLLHKIGKRYILTLHGGNLPLFARYHPKRLGRLLRNADAVTTPSEYLQSQMIRFRRDIRLIPNPLDIGRYEFRQRNTVVPSLIWLRAFHRIYNPSLALYVVNTLKDKFPTIQLLMVGPDKHDGSLAEFRRDLARLGLEQNVTIIGSILKMDIPVILQRGDIFINTSNVDNTPVSVLEAMASGLCIVSTNVGGIPYLLKHEQDALLVPPDDSHAMANAVSTLLDLSDLAKKISFNARRKAEQKDTKQTILLWESLFREILHD